MENKRTPEEVKAKIAEITADPENFTDTSFGLDDYGNRQWDTSYSEYYAATALQKFADWLYGKDDI